jgi:lipoate-protein ligase A
VKEWRLLRLKVNDAFTNMAIDEAITTARIECLVPNTLRFYTWKPSAVSIGRFQDVYNEVHVENCRRRKVDIVRRITGGGTVYHDSDDEITYSVVVKETDFGTTDVVQAYNMISGGLIEVAKILGVKADFNPGDPRNCPSIAVNGKKISGSAQFHRHGVLLQHGTFLLDVNLEKMFTFLRVPWAKNIEDVVCVARDKLTSIGKELNHKVGIDEAYEALVLGFQKALKIEFQEDLLTAQEQHLAEKLQKEKFSNDSWNLTGKTTLQENDKIYTLKNQ